MITVTRDTAPAPLALFRSLPRAERDVVCLELKNHVLEKKLARERDVADVAARLAGSLGADALDLGRAIARIRGAAGAPPRRSGRVHAL